MTTKLDELMRLLREAQPIGHTEPLEAALVELVYDHDRFKADYESACRTVADMHTAAVGPRSSTEHAGAIRGVVEDVADVRTAMLTYREYFLAMRSYETTIGHEEATPKDEHKAEQRLQDAARAAAAITDWKASAQPPLVSMDVARAFGALKEAIQTDVDGYGWSWHCGIAVPAMGAGIHPQQANEAAARVMDMLFSVDMRACKYFANVKMYSSNQFYDDAPWAVQRYEDRNQQLLVDELPHPGPVTMVEPAAPVESEGGHVD